MYAGFFVKRTLPRQDRHTHFLVVARNSVREIGLKILAVQTVGPDQKHGGRNQRDWPERRSDACLTEIEGLGLAFAAIRIILDL